MPKKKPLKAAAKKKRRQGGKGKPFQSGNEWAWEKGQSGNPGGRPKMAETYAEWLDLKDPETGLLNRQRVVSRVGLSALAGDTTAAREIRQAVDGDTLHGDGGLIHVSVDR